MIGRVYGRGIWQVLTTTPVIMYLPVTCVSTMELECMLPWRPHLLYCGRGSPCMNLYSKSK